MSATADPLLPYDSQEITVPNASGEPFHLRYLDEGPRDTELGPLVCVHGNPTWSFYFRRVVQHFRSTRRVIACDHLGCGRSDKPPADQFRYDLAAHRDNLVQLLDGLDLSDATLVAHDWGGPIGLSALLARPQRFRQVCLFNTAAFPPPYVPKRIAVCRWPIVGSWAVRRLNLFARAAQVMTTSRAPLPRDVRRAMITPYDTWEHRVAIDAFVRDIPMRSDHPTFERLRELEQGLRRQTDLPVLMVWGMQDWCFNPACLRKMQQIFPQAITREIDDAGHYVLEDAPEECLEALEGFLEGDG